MTNSVLDQMRSWSFRNFREFWSLYHENKNKVTKGQVMMPEGGPLMNRKATPGNMLVAALLEILRLRRGDA